MSLLFTIENQRVIPNPETLLISPFKEIWERDKDKKKSRAIEELTFIEFMTSEKKSNPYSGYKREDRREKIIQQVIKNVNWEEDDLIIEAMEKLEEFQTEASVTYSYYMAAKKAAEEMKDFFLTFDMSEKNMKTGNPLYKPKEITSSIRDTKGVLEDLNALKDKVDAEIFEASKTRGKKTISRFAKID